MHSTLSLPQAFQSAHISSHVTGNTAPSSPDHVTCAPRSRDRSWLRTFSLDHSFLNYSTTQPSTPSLLDPPRPPTSDEIMLSDSPSSSFDMLLLDTCPGPGLSGPALVPPSGGLAISHKCLVHDCGRLLCSVPAPASAGSERLRVTGL